MVFARSNHGKPTMAVFMSLVLTLSFVLSSCAPRAKNGTTMDAAHLMNELRILIGSLRYKDAVLQLETNYQVVKKDAPLLSSYASMEYHIFGDDKKAEDLVRKAIKIDPNQPDYHMLLGYIKEHQGKYKEATGSFQRAADFVKSPEGIWDLDRAKAHKSMGDCWSALGEDESALKEYETAARYNPYDIDLNATLHRIYVQREEYDRAYGVWKTSNLVVDDEPNVYPTVDRWNGLYKNALPAGAQADYLKLARMYSELVLYDEAKTLYEKALKDVGHSEEIDERLSEVNTYLAFRDAFKRLLDDYYRDRCIDGPAAENDFFGRLEPAYRTIAGLFPGLGERKTSSQSWIESLDREIEKRFGVRITHIKADASKMGSHFGRIINNSPVHRAQWDREIDLEVVVLKNMVSNGLDDWRTMGQSGVGGWSGGAAQVVKVIQNSEYDRVIGFVQLKDEGYRHRALQEALRYSDDTARQPSDIYFSPEVSVGLVLRQMDLELQRVRQNDSDSEDTVNNSIFSRVATLQLTRSSIYAHEGQHSLDGTYGAPNRWLGENEYRAKLSQLAYAGMGFLTLSGFYGPSIGTDDQNSHTRANTQVFKDIVQYILDHGEEFPMIDVKKSILAQLPELNEQDLEEIAVGIFEAKYPEKYLR